MDTTTDPQPPQPSKPSRAELVELALRYAYEHDRKGAFDFDTWHAACSLVLGDIGGTAVATTTLLLQQALDSYRSGPTRDQEDGDAQAKALWATLQSALVGGQAFADPEAARNYLAVTFVGMRSPLFDRAEVHFIRPGGFSPHQRAEVAGVQAAGLREQVRGLEAWKREAMTALADGHDEAKAVGWIGRESIGAFAKRSIEVRDQALRTREDQINEVHARNVELERQRNSAAAANGELAWLVADRIWAGELFKGEAAGELLAGEPPEEDEGTLTARERGFMVVVNELKERAKPARDALEAELRGLLDEVGAICVDIYTNEKGPLAVDDAVTQVQRVSAAIGRRLKAIGAAP